MSGVNFDPKVYLLDDARLEFWRSQAGRPVPNGCLGAVDEFLSHYSGSHREAALQLVRLPPRDICRNAVYHLREDLDQVRNEIDNLLAPHFADPAQTNIFAVLNELDSLYGRATALSASVKSLFAESVAEKIQYSAISDVLSSTITGNSKILAALTRHESLALSQTASDLKALEARASNLAECALGFSQWLRSPDPQANAVDKEPIRLLEITYYEGQSPERAEFTSLDDRLFVRQGMGAMFRSSQTPVGDKYGHCKTLLLHNPLNGLYSYHHVANDLVSDAEFNHLNLARDMGPGPKSAIWIRGSQSREVDDNDNKLLEELGFSCRALDVETGNLLWASSFSQNRIYVLVREDQSVRAFSGF